MNNQLEIIGKIPTAWTDHITFAQWIVNKKQPEVIVDLGVVSKNSNLIKEIQETFQLDK